MGLTNAPVSAGSKYETLLTIPVTPELLVDADPKKVRGSPDGLVKPRAVTRIRKSRAVRELLVKTNWVRSRLASSGDPGEFVIAAVRPLLQSPTAPV
jgi:hypothetical protein